MAIRKKHLCWYCGRSTHQHGHTRDHVVPRCKGGTKTVICCGPCNRLKAAMSVEEFRLVLAYRQGLIPNGMDILKFHGELHPEPVKPTDEERFGFRHRSQLGEQMADQKIGT